MKVSILLLTIDRYNMCRTFVQEALDNAGVPFDLCVSDNGSKDPKMIEWIEQKNPKVFFNNGYNYGTAQSLNRMIEANPSDYYVFIGNDIRLPKNWLKTMIEYANEVENHGVIGIDWRMKTYPEKRINSEKFGIIWETSNVFGTMFISQKLRDKIGKFCEDYGVYGIWDGDYSIRANKAGLTNFYIPNMRSEHMGNDVGERSEYRKMKDESLSKARPIFEQNKKKYENGEYFI